MDLNSTWLTSLSSFSVIAALAAIHITIGRWKWLDRTEHSPWLSVSAGAALAYVFVYLLPKIALTQSKLDEILASSDWEPLYMVSGSHNRVHSMQFLEVS